MLHLYLFSTAIFMLIALLNLLTTCLHPSRGLATQNFLFLLIPILSIFLQQELTGIFTLSSLTTLEFQQEDFVHHTGSGGGVGVFQE